MGRFPALIPFTVSKTTPQADSATLYLVVRLLATRNGTPFSERNLLRRVLKPAGEKLGIPWLSWHVFRHTHATLGEEIGMALSDRQAQMGHGDVRMTMHYTHSDMNRRRLSIEAMTDRLVGNGVPLVI